MKKGLYALALGTFGLGISEYIMMSILPDVAFGFGVSLAEAGHLISVYALGVCVGAPLIVIVARNWPLRRILLALVGVFVAGNLLMTFSFHYSVAMAARFISGLPHGAYFGVGSIVASRLARHGKSASAVALMVMGMTVANLLGVPLGNWVGYAVSWRAVFAFATVWGIITMIGIRRWIPEMPSLPNDGMKGQFGFLRRPEPWLLIVATVLSNGGIFCWYSYVNPLLTQVSGIPVSSMPLMMLLSGGSMCVGNYLGGFMSDRFTPQRVSMYTQFVMFVALLATFFLADYAVAAVVLMCICTGALFAVSSPQQLLLLRHSPGGEMMGGAMVQLAFNLGNALGAFCGGFPVDHHVGIQYTALIGSAFAFMGGVVLLVFNLRYARKS